LKGAIKDQNKNQYQFEESPLPLFCIWHLDDEKGHISLRP